MADAKFPAPKKLGARAVGWLARDVEAFIAALPSARLVVEKQEAA
jgi:predicted DNA-binding transcriptional regulator AlpA